jgi:hypothetical protein
MSVQVTSSAAGSAENFRQEIGQVIGSLRAALMEVLEVAGEIKRSRDVQDRLKLNMTLSWQIYRILNVSENLVELSPHIPSTGMMQKLLNAVRGLGASEASLTTLSEAHARFESLVEFYAGDRESFNAIASRLMGNDAQSQIELVHRRAAFECERHVWGLDLEAAISCEIFGPLLTGQPDQSVSLRLKRNLRRLSFNQNFAVDKHSVRKSDVDEFEKHPTTLPLNSTAFSKYGIPILPPFCSSLDIPLRHFEQSDSVVTEWIGDSMGKPSSVDIAMGDIHHNPSEADRNSGQNKLTYQRGSTFGIPTRQRISDVIVHRATRGQLTTTLTRWGHSMDRPKQLYPVEAMGLPKLPCHDRYMLVGTGRGAAYLSEAPQYTKMLQYACDTMGWNLEEMDIYRVRMEFPLLHTLIAVTLDFDLPATAH